MAYVPDVSKTNYEDSDATWIRISKTDLIGNSEERKKIASGAATGVYGIILATNRLKI